MNAEMKRSKGRQTKEIKIKASTNQNSQRTNKREQWFSTVYLQTKTSQWPEKQNTIKEEQKYSNFVCPSTIPFPSPKLVEK